MGEHEFSVGAPYAVTNCLGTVLISFGVVTASIGVGSGHLAGVLPLSSQMRSWEEFNFSSTQTRIDRKIDWRATLIKFAERLVVESVEPDPEFDEIASERFWDLL